MDQFFETWGEAAYTSLGFFWMALWAFVLGYFISSLIQVLVTRKRMREVMGDGGPRSIFLGTFFGFISSSCSFAALATTRALFNKGASFASAMAFMLASTNLVIELGFVIAIFLGWQFVVGEYLGGVLLILLAWLFIWLTKPYNLIEQARSEEEDDEDGTGQSIRHWGDLTDPELWQQVSMKYVMEWQMVWKDVLIGFTAAGAISAFVPTAFFEWLFMGVGTVESDAQLSFLSVLQQAMIGPIAAFFTFIGSMGNIPLAAVLFGEGVAFAGVMAFIFSDLIVFPVLRINAQYYGWKMALYIMLMLFVCLVVTSIVMHYGLFALDMLPDRSDWTSPAEQQHFEFDYGFILNILFLALTAVLIYFWRIARHGHHDHDHGGVSIQEIILRTLSVLAVIWLVGGMISRAIV